MRVLPRDLRLSIRVLAKSPGFVLVAVLSLALGIGANTAIFSVVNTLLLKTLPVHEPRQLAGLYPVSRGSSSYSSFSYLNYRDFRDRSRTFSGLMAYGLNPLNLSTGGHAERIWGNLATANYFSVLGIHPERGRFFLPEEEQTPGGHPVAVISHGLWMRRFGGDNSAIGRRILLNGHGFTVVGIAGKEFRGTELGLAPDIWVPMMMQAQILPGWDALGSRGAGWLHVVGRVKPGMAIDQVRADSKRIAAELASEYPLSNERMEVSVEPNFSVIPELRGGIRSLMLILMALVGTLLLLACVNVAGLMLSRTAARANEIAMRMALGAPRSRILRQLLTESVLVSMAGGACGIVAGLWILDLIAKLQSASPLPTPIAFELDGGVLAFTLALSVGTGLLFGLAPGWHATRTGIAGIIKSSAASKSAGTPRLRSLMVAAQIAMAFLLLVAAGLFVKSFRNASQADPGFDSARLLQASFDLGAQGYDAKRGRSFMDTLLQRVASEPGILRASLAMNDPLGLNQRDNGVFIEGAARSTPISFNAVEAGFFEAMSIPLAAGRPFDTRDRADSPPVAMINETMARRFFPDAASVRQVIGKRISFESATGPFLEIVGVARDSKYFSVAEHSLPYFYLPLSQSFSTAVTLVVRTRTDPAAILPTVERQVHRLDPSLPVYHLQTMQHLVASTLTLEEFSAKILTFFGVTALLLAVIGVYGLLAYTVSQRTREVGIRMALGATRSDVLRAVVRKGLLLAAAGMAFGAAGALSVTGLFRSQLFEVTSADPFVFTAAAILLAAAAFAACIVPAHRATRVDPMVALRYE
jgi:macrolide transport system ATP-binding/permease protein